MEPPMSSEGGNRWFADSSLEESGFEPSVPQKTPGGVVVLVRFAPTFPVAGIKQRRYERLSNPGRITRYRRFESAFSSGESRAKLNFEVRTVASEHASRGLSDRKCRGRRHADPARQRSGRSPSRGRGADPSCAPAQEVRGWAVLREDHGGPGAGRVVLAEYPARSS